MVLEHNGGVSESSRDELVVDYFDAGSAKLTPSTNYTTHLMRCQPSTQAPGRLRSYAPPNGKRSASSGAPSRIDAMATRFSESESTEEKDTHIQQRLLPLL